MPFPLGSTIGALALPSPYLTKNCFLLQSASPQIFVSLSINLILVWSVPNFFILFVDILLDVTLFVDILSS